MPFVRLTRFFYQRNSAFRRKILVGFLLSSILPVLLIGSLAYSFSYKIARDSIIQSITYANIQLSNTISNRFLQGANAADILPAYLFPLVQAKGQSIVSQLDRVSQIRSYLAIQRDAYQFYRNGGSIWPSCATIPAPGTCHWTRQHPLSSNSATISLT